MRIEPTGDSIAVGPASPARPDIQIGPPTRHGTDHVDLTALSRAAAGFIPARIEEIQASVASGTYQVNAAEVSRRVVDFYLIPVK